MKRAFVTVDLGFGDSGKGATVDALCRRYDCDLVIRYSGGHQAGHTVQLADGHRHRFSQFGAGTFAGAATYIGPEVIVNPVAMRREAEALAEKTGHDPYDKLLVHPDCLVSTAFHREVNRAKEKLTGHGSCGMGIGETRSYWLNNGEDAITIADCKSYRKLSGKLRLLKERFVAGEFKDSCLGLPVAEVARSLNSMSLGIRISELPPSCTNVVFEASQGMLIDQNFGFYPHYTWSDVSLRPAIEILAQIDHDSETSIGITRAYMTRHGAGPFPTFSEELSASLSDDGNKYNEWQGHMRFGWLDLDLIRYAVTNCGRKLDGLAVNHFDQLPENCQYADREAYWDVIADLDRPQLVVTDVNGIRGKLSGIAPIMVEGFGPSASHRKFIG